MALSKRKVQIEPVLEAERQAIQLLSTPTKPPGSPRTPNSLVKRMSRVSLSEQKNWSVSKTDGTKLLLKRAILADKNEKDSPKKTTPKSTPKPHLADTPKNSKLLSKNNIEDILSMELKENSDEELPTLIIRQHVPTTPKRKQSISKTTDETPKKVLVFEEDEKEPYLTRSGRVSKNPINYREEELSPVKRTPTRSGRLVKNPVSYIEEDVSPVKRTPQKMVRKMAIDNEDDDFKPTPKTPRTPRTPKTSKVTPAKTPKRSTRKIVTSQLTPNLHTRVHSVDNIDGMWSKQTFILIKTILT